MIAARGETVTLHGRFTTWAGILEDAVAPKVTVTDPVGVDVVSLADPDTHPSLGEYRFDFAIPADAMLGDWTVTWTGVVDGATVAADGPLTVTTGVPIGAALTCSPWIDETNLRCDIEGVNPDLVLLAIQAATDLLYTATAEIYPGVCTDTYRPCGCSCGSTACGCRHLAVLEPRRAPLVDVVSVTVDGIVLVRGTDFQVLDGRLVQRIGGHVWPCGQNLELATTERDTWEISYTWGVAPPAAGLVAAAALACELLAAWSGGDCRLPKRLTTVTGEGWSQVLLDPFAFLEGGVFGVSEIDYFVRMANPDKLTRQGRYLSPELLSRGFSVS